MAAGFARWKHAHEDPVGSVAVDHDRALLERLGVGEHYDGRCVSGLSRRNADKSSNRDQG
jgi:hypothetical protein